MKSEIKHIDPTWEPHMTTKGELAKCEALTRFTNKHCQFSKYLVVVHKCNDMSCEFGCGPLRMPKKRTKKWYPIVPRSFHYLCEPVLKSSRSTKT